MNTFWKENLNERSPWELWRLSEQEFREWLRGKEKSDIMSLRHEIHEDLGELRDSLDSLSQQKLDSPKNLDRKGISSHPPMHEKNDIFSYPISTRKPEDAWKNLVQWATESLVMPFKVIADGVGDFGKFILSPRAEIRRTIAYLESESPAKII